MPRCVSECFTMAETETVHYWLIDAENKPEWLILIITIDICKISLRNEIFLRSHKEGARLKSVLIYKSLFLSLFA
jgi:hypothetical protein